MSAGDTTWSAARPLLAGIVAALALVAGFLGWSATARIAGAVIAHGQVEVDRNRQTLQHPDGGVVAAILVSEGERVAAGQVLMRLDGSLLRPELAIVEGQYLEALARQGRLVAERDGLDAPGFPAALTELFAHRADARAHAEGQRRLFEARALTFVTARAQLERRREQGQAQLRGLDRQQSALDDERALLVEELAGQERLLSQGLIPAARVVALRRDLVRLDGLLGAIGAELAQVQGRITEIGLEIVNREAAWHEAAEAELRDLGIRILELAERRRTLAERIDRLDLRAPVDGVVHGLAINTPRAVLRPAEPLLQIVPSDRPLVLTVRIAPADIDHVFVGQRVNVVVQALSRRGAPELRGTVAQISADAFHDQAGGQSFFRAEIALDEAVSQHPGGAQLVPGMQAEAFIRTRERTPLDYLTQPLTDHFRRAFRES